VLTSCIVSARHCGRSSTFKEPTVNAELDQLARRLGLATPASRPLALAFGLHCVERIEHLLEEPEVIACLGELRRFALQEISEAALALAATEANRLANQHRGSKSIDGCGHAAVSATYAVANAVSGKALQAAQYAAYAEVYASGGYAAVADHEAFTPAFQWQVECLGGLAAEAGLQVA
jgi:hypothetical protein